MQHKKNLNIVVVGKSGAGKSSLLNYLVNAEKDIFEAGIGKPITQTYFKEHSYTNPATNITYKLYDTKGIEPGITSEFISEINGKIEKFKESDDFFQHLHTLYYCLDASSKRIEPFEEKFIKKMSKSLDVVIVLTKADLISEDELEVFYEILKKDFNASEKDIDADIRISKVCSVVQRTRKATSEKFGRENVLKHSFVGLWNTFSKSIPKKIYEIILDHDEYVFKLKKGLDDEFKFNIPFDLIMSFKTRWCDYYNIPLLAATNVNLTQENILNFPDLKNLDIQNLEKENKAILKLFLKHCSRLVSQLTVKKQLAKFELEIKFEAEKIISFYSLISGKHTNKPISLIESKRKLYEIEEFMENDFRPNLNKIIEDFASKIIIENFIDNWFTKDATEDKKSFNVFFHNFTTELSTIKERRSANLKDFESICATELKSYGRYVLDMTDVDADEIEYEKEVRYAVEDDGIVDTGERRFLERFKRIKTSLTEKEANEIENRVREELDNKKLI